jgi:hypothetical protein
MHPAIYVIYNFTGSTCIYKSKNNERKSRENISAKEEEMLGEEVDISRAIIFAAQKEVNNSCEIVALSEKFVDRT